MRIDLSGKTAIITGSTAGIGLATAKGLAAAGAKVVVNGRTPEAVERAVKASSLRASATIAIRRWRPRSPLTRFWNHRVSADLG